MQAEGGPARSGGQARRVAHGMSCVNCVRLRKKCDPARPCAQCVHRNVSCEDSAVYTSCTRCSATRAKCDKGRPCERCREAGHASTCSSVTDRMRRPQNRPHESPLWTLSAAGANFDAGGLCEPPPQMTAQDISALVAALDVDRDSVDEAGGGKEDKQAEDGAPDIVEIPPATSTSVASPIDAPQSTTHMVSSAAVISTGASTLYRTWLRVSAQCLWGRMARNSQSLASKALSTFL